MDKEVLLLKPFIIYSDQVRQTFPILAYYLKFYAIKKGGTIQQKYRNQDDGSNILPELISEWQADLNGLSSQIGSALQNQTDCKQKIIDYTMQIFAKADYEYRNNSFSKETQNNMNLVSRYLEILAVFGPLTEDINQKRVYSKAKAVEIKKKLENPQQNQNQRAPNQQQPSGQGQNSYGNQQPFQQPSNNYNNNFANTGNNNNNNGFNARQSVFNNLPTIVNANNIKTVANNYNEFDIGENPNTAQLKPKYNEYDIGNNPNSAAQKPKVQEPSSKYADNYKPAPQFVQFPNPYMKQVVGFNIPQQQAQAKVVEYCKTAIQELDFDQYSNAKEALKLALLTIQNTSN